jgi:transposase
MRPERNTQKNWRTNSWVLFDDNAPAHRSVVVKDFLAETYVKTVQRPPYSSEMAAADFYLFPRLKSTLKGRRFCDTADISKNATEELKRLSQNGFQECFEHFCSHW